MLVLGVGKFENILIVQIDVPKCAFSSSGKLRLEMLRLGLNYIKCRFRSTDTHIVTHYCTSVHWDSCLVVTAEGGADGRGR